MADDGPLTKLSRLKSPWILHYDCSSCNGCDIEILACLTPYYDIERFGILNKGNPKHADVLMVTGSVNHKNKVVLKNLYEQIPSPKVVIVVGACGSTGGVFHNCYNVLGGVDKVIPVDVYVPGCPPKPEAIIDGVVKALEKLKALQEGTWAEKKAEKEVEEEKEKERKEEENKKEE
ncbi:MAG: NADH-quinone oxidoreductase subunit B family protein [Thermoplasmata archaeon]